MLREEEAKEKQSLKKGREEGRADNTQVDRRGGMEIRRCRKIERWRGR